MEVEAWKVGDRYVYRMLNIWQLYRTDIRMTPSSGIKKLLAGFKTPSVHTLPGYLFGTNQTFKMCNYQNNQPNSILSTGVGDHTSWLLPICLQYVYINTDIPSHYDVTVPRIFLRCLPLPHLS